MYIIDHYRSLYLHLLHLQVFFGSGSNAVPRVYLDDKSLPLAETVLAFMELHMGMFGVQYA